MVSQQELDALYKQLELHLGRTLTPQEKKLLALGEVRAEVIPMVRRSDDRTPTEP